MGNNPPRLDSGRSAARTRRDPDPGEGAHVGGVSQAETEGGAAEGLWRHGPDDDLCQRGQEHTQAHARGQTGHKLRTGQLTLLFNRSGSSYNERGLVSCDVEKIAIFPYLLSFF